LVFGVLLYSVLVLPFFSIKFPVSPSQFKDSASYVEHLVAQEMDQDSSLGPFTFGKMTTCFRAQLKIEEGINSRLQVGIFDTSAGSKSYAVFVKLSTIGAFNGKHCDDSDIFVKLEKLIVSLLFKDSL
jgi:hypothetical protein